jgi:hypothetical protein
MCLNDPWPTHESLDAGSDRVRCGRQYEFWWEEAEHSDEEDVNMFAGGTYLDHGLMSISQLGHRSSFALVRLLGHELWGNDMPMSYVNTKLKSR